MRRTFLVVLAVLLAANAVPVVRASPSAIRFDMPAGALPGDAIVPIDVTLVVQDFMCHEPRDFVVFLTTNTTEGVKATFAKTNLTFSTPSRAYFAEPFSQTQTVNLTVRALANGHAEITAWMDPSAPGACFAPNGFEGARTTVMVQVDAAPAGPTSATPSPPTPPAPTNETSEPTNKTATPSPATPTPPPRENGQGVCPPGEVCGPIGDYAAPQESANDTPGLGMIGALAAVALGALLLERRKT